MENTMNGAAAGGAILVVTLIWVVIYLGVFVWYLWAMARLLSRLGMPNWTGWVPVWNEWNLLIRGGYPGWIAILMLVPVANLVFVIVRIMAVHRVNTEFGKGVGFTVLGALIAPLWATLLGSAIGPQGQMPSAGPAYGGQANPYAPPHQVGVQVQHFQGPGGYGAQGSAQPASGEQAYPAPSGNPFAPAPPQPPSPRSAPASPHHAPHAPQPGSAPSQFAQDPAGGQHQAPLGQQGPQGSQGQPVQQTPWEQIVQVPPPPGAQQGPAESASGTGNLPPVNDPNHPNHHVDPTPSNTWGLSATIGREFHRLAAEEEQAPPATPLTPSAPQQSFEWPTDRRAQWQQRQAEQSAAHTPEDDSAPLPPVPPEALIPQPDLAPPSVHPMPPAPPVAPVASDAPAGSAVSDVPGMPTTPGVPEVPVIDDDAPTIFEQAPPIHPAAQATGQAHGTASAQASADEPVETSLDELFDLGGNDDDLDRTIVAPRPMRQKWALVLTDGHEIELTGNDVVIGRKPAPVDGATPVAIPDPSRTLSKSHARLRFGGDAWTIEDLGSTNGVALIRPDGTEHEVDPHSEVAATEHLVIGTLEVSLRRVD